MKNFKIITKKIKGKSDSLFYDTIATAEADDGAKFEVKSCGDIRFTYKGEEYDNGHCYKVLDELNDQKLADECEFENNDWFEVFAETINGRYIDFGSSYADTYESAIQMLKDSVKDYENKEEYITVSL
jgi:hypothetical protein